MKKYIILSMVLVGLLAGLFLMNKEAPVTTPKAAIEKGLNDLKSSGQIEPGQESILKVQLAIADYISKNYEPPASLESLIPKYFDSVPIDPITKKPIGYQKKGDEFELIFESVKLDSSQQTGKKSSDGVSIEFNNPNSVVIEDFVYDPKGKRDPFQPFEVNPTVEIDDSLPPLQRYQLGQLRAAAILTDSDGQRFAMVEDATGRGYTVKVGDIVGNKNGKVVSIDESQVNVLESSTNFAGEVTQELIPIKLVTGGSSRGPVKRKGRGRR